ncbi:MAG: hypothetical protein EOO38_27695, partial [Cytophagaceae bacterium]
MELSRISGYILCETFKIAPRNYTSSFPTNNIDIALKMLQTWQEQLPAVLQMPESLMHSDPSCNLLHMAQNQLVILVRNPSLQIAGQESSEILPSPQVTRPVLLAAVKRSVAQRLAQGRPPQHCQARHIYACSAAAHRNLLLAQQITLSGRKLLQAGLHFVFNAAVVLLLKRIMANPDHTDEEAVQGTLTASLPVDDPYAPS